jgi:2-keto-4-pentenoate hydratase
VMPRPDSSLASGTCLEPMPVGPGDRVTMDFGALGGVSMRFAPA